MTPQRFFEHFDRISDAPDAIPRLRRFILDLAVRGKLVEQNPRDEPASELLKRIQTEKVRLVNADEIKKGKQPLPIDEDEIPFTIPTTWKWVRLNDITSYIQRGKSPKYSTGEGLPVISQRCVQWGSLDLNFAKLITHESIKDYEAIRFLRSGDLLWNSTGTGTIGRVIKVKEPIPQLVCDSHVTVVRCLEVDAEYIRSWLRSDHVYGVIEERAAGSTNQVELTSQLAMNQVVPLPPLFEQHRIVAKVDELMALFDRLEAAQAERESRRNRLVASSLNRLNNGADADAFQDHARFYFNHLPHLTTKGEHIQQLRQTILNLAVRGKLAPQDPNDEASSLLYDRLNSEMAKARQKERASPRRDLLPAADGFFSNDVFPPSWVLTNFDKLNTIISGVAKGKDLRGIKTATYPYLRVANVQRGYLDLAIIKELEICADEFSRYQLRTGDVLMTEGGDWDKLGRAAIWNDEIPNCIHQNHIYRIRPANKEDLLPEWIMLFANSPLGRSYFEGASKQTTNLASINMTQLRSCPLPLPPLAEQQRIVAKVDELMALCDKLEAQLTTTHTESRHLLDAVLHEALKPAFLE